MPNALVKTDWSSGNLRFKDKDGNVIATWDATNRVLEIPSGSKINVKTGGKLQNNGVDMDLSAGIATATTSSTAELNTLTGVTGGTAAASKAVVLDANKGVTGLGAVGHRQPYTAMGANGAAAIAPGVIGFTKAGVCAATLADPAAGDEGTVMTFIALTANAHTLSNAAGSGFNGGGAASDVGTFGGAIGDRIEVIAIGGKWYVLNNVNVTLA